MDLLHRIETAENLTPTDQALANAVIGLHENIDAYSLEDLARASHTSTAAVSRFCKKLGFRGFRDFKVEAVRSSVVDVAPDSIDVNYPFYRDDSPRIIGQGLHALYEKTLSDTMRCLDYSALYEAARMMSRAKCIDIYMHAHNLYIGEMLHERLLKIGRRSTIARTSEERLITAAASDSKAVAVIASYSGRAASLPGILNILRRKNVPAIFITTKDGARLHPGLACYLLVSDQEDARARISQFASHVALQYVTDVLYSCLFTIDYDRNLSFLKTMSPLVDGRQFE